jgi:hypothetical protein
MAYKNRTKHQNLFTIDEKAGPQYKEFCRIDPLVGKQSGNRKDGKLMARRTSTTKFHSDQLCCFSIRLILYPGEYWCIEHHLELSADEERR